MQEASAKKIQAIQRGKHDRRVVQEKKLQKKVTDKLAPQDEDEAKLQEKGALRIQSLQRGKQDRKKVEEKKAAMRRQVELEFSANIDEAMREVASVREQQAAAIRIQ